MAHFARIENGIVREVIVINNADCSGGDYPEAEAAGQSFIAGIGLAGTWHQTSYNSNFRGTYSGIGYKFDAERNQFVPPDWELVDGEWTAPPEIEEPEARILPELEESLNE